jgi:hypothetical protein
LSEDDLKELAKLFRHRKTPSVVRGISSTHYIVTKNAAGRVEITESPKNAASK